MAKGLNIVYFGSAQSIHVRRWVAFLAARGHRLSILSNFPTEVPGATVYWLTDRARYGRLAYPASLVRARRILRSIDPDLVHVHYLGGNALYAPLVTDWPLISSPWGSDVYTAGPARHLLLWYTMHKSQYVLTTSAAMADLLVRCYRLPKAKILTLSWGIDASLFRPVSDETKRALRRELLVPEAEFVVVSNRTAAPLYRTEVLVRAFLQASVAAPDLYLVVMEGPPGAGNLTSYREGIKKLAEHQKERIRILDHAIAPELMARYLQCSDAVVSIPVSDQRSTSVLEALGCASIVILSHIPPYVELQQDGYEVVLLENPTVDSLSNALLAARALPHSVLLNATARNYRLATEKENWETQAAKVEQVYLEVAARRVHS